VINLVTRRVEDKKQRANHDLRRNVEGFWEFFQKSHQAMFIVNELVRFDSIVAIDGEGDLLHKFPHIYVDFQGNRGPFVGFYEYLEIDQHHHERLDGLQKVEKFPKTFSTPYFGNIYRDKTICVSNQVRARLKSGIGTVHTIYSSVETLEYLNPGDMIGVDQSVDYEGKQVLIKITNKRQERGRDFLNRKDNDPMLIHGIEEQIGRNLKSNDTIFVYEFKVVYEWQLEKR
jgi:hypothetical protein